MYEGVIQGRVIAAAAVLGTLWTLEAAWPMFRGRREHTRHYARNVFLGLFNAGMVAFVFAGALSFVAESARASGFGLLNWIEGLLNWNDGLLNWTELPWAAYWLAGIVLLDAWQYAWHVMNHKLPILWRFHAVHHSDAELDASTAVRFHTGEIALSSIVRLAVIPVLGLSIMHVAVYELISLPIVMFHHSNVRIPSGLDRVVRLFVVTPRMHWVHHSDYQPETDSNFATISPVWDRVFGTFKLRQDPLTLNLGLRDFEEPEWRPLLGFLAIPFRHYFRRSNKNEPVE